MNDRIKQKAIDIAYEVADDLAASCDDHLQEALEDTIADRLCWEEPETPREERRAAAQWAAKQIF